MPKKPTCQPRADEEDVPQFEDLSYERQQELLEKDAEDRYNNPLKAEDERILPRRK